MASMNTNSPMRIKVLVVDDDWTSLSIVSSMLKKWSYEVVTVKSPVDAMATLRMQRNYFNLVVTDLHMPVMNGAELARQIKVEFKNIPVILMSADDKESVIVECLASGAVYYIIKPINPEDLKNVWQYAAAAARKRKSPVREEIDVTLQDLEDIDLDGGPLTSSGDDDNDNDDVGFSSCAGESNKRNKASPRDEEDEGLTNSKAKKPKVIWTTVLHNLFLQAIRHIGLERAVPKKILEFMRVPGLTRENVASHLQKYRLFLKRVAMRNLVSERALRSSFAVGHPSLMMARNAQLQQLYPNHMIGQQSLRLSTLGPPLFPTPRHRHHGPSGSRNLINQLHYSLPNPAIPFQPNSFLNNNNMVGRLNSFNMTSGAHSQGLVMNNIMQLSHQRNNGVGYGINGAYTSGNGMQLINANQQNLGTTTSNYNNPNNTCIAPMGHVASGNLGQVSGGFGYPNQLMNPNHDLGHLMINGSDTFSGNLELYPAVNASQMFNPNLNNVGPNEGGEDENATGQVISNASVNINNNGGVEKSYSLDELMSSTLTTNSTNSIDLDALFLDHINNPLPHPTQQQDKGKEVMNYNGSANYNYNGPRVNEDLNFDELHDLFPMELNDASWDHGQSLPMQNQNQNQADVGVEVVNSNFGTTTPYPPYQFGDLSSFPQNPSQSHLSQNQVGMRGNVYQSNHYNTSFLQNPNQQLQEGTGGSMDADLFAMVQNIGNGSHHQYLNQNQQNWGDHDGLMQLVRSGGPCPNKE